MPGGTAPAQDGAGQAPNIGGLAITAGPQSLPPVTTRPPPAVPSWASIAGRPQVTGSGTGPSTAARPQPQPNTASNSTASSSSATALPPAAAPTFTPNPNATALTPTVLVNSAAAPIAGPAIPPSAATPPTGAANTTAATNATAAAQQAATTLTQAAIGNQVPAHYIAPPPATIQQAGSAPLTGVTGNSQHTNQALAAQYASDATQRRIDAEYGQAVRQRWSQKELEAKWKHTQMKWGLRTAFANGQNSTKIVTNHLTMQWPNTIYVYTLDMIRGLDNNNNEISVKKQWDKMEIVRQLATQNHVAQMQTNTASWVSDGDLIWSTVELFQLPAPLNQLPPGQHHTAPANQRHPVLATITQPPVTYTNEMGSNLTMRQVSIYYNQTITLNRDMATLFFDNLATGFNDSVPGIITRGLNAFFTKHVRGQQGVNRNAVTMSGLNKSFRNFGTPLDPPTNPMLRAVRGFFLSMRPGIENMYLNISSGTSPFFEPMTVYEWIRRNQGRRTPHEIYQALKGLKVQITYKTNGQHTPLQRVRLINCPPSGQIISAVSPSPLPNANPNPPPPTYSSHNRARNPANIQCLQDWYDPANGFAQHQDFPNPPINQSLNANDYAINVGRDPNRTPNESEWYPASCLQILEWQPFRGRLTGAQTAQMVRVAIQQPHPHRDLIESDRQANLPAPGQQYQNHHSTEGGISHFGFARNGQLTQGLLQALGMSAGVHFMQIPGEWLAPPTVLYAAGQAPHPGPNHQRPRWYREAGFRGQITEARWNVANAGFVERATIQRCPVLILCAGNPNPGDQAQGHVLPANFDHMLRQQLFQHGILPQNLRNTLPIPKIQHVITSASFSQQWENDFRTALQLVNACPHEVVMVVLAENDAPHYSLIKKIADCEQGVKTIVAAADKSLRPGNWDEQTVSNIAMKYNIKSARATHRLGDNALQPLRTPSTTIANTIVIGADVAHPTGGSHTGTPSIAGVVGSVDNDFAHFPGSMRLQRSKKEDIVELHDMVKERLIDWGLEHGRKLPKKMLFYRDGVSESQYDIARRRELPQLQVAYSEAFRFFNPTAALPLAPGLLGANELPGAAGERAFNGAPQNVSTKVKQERQKAAEEGAARVIEEAQGNQTFELTFIVVGKRHNTRFYPTRPYVDAHCVSNRNRNVKPGLVVDQVITHPFNMDFYLQSHLPIQGTGRSAHYYVLRNAMLQQGSDMPLTMDQLQRITHAFCYNYARATRGVSYCAPAYYADRLCDRGSKYLRHYLIGMDGYGPRARITQPPPGETYQQYLDAIRDGIYNSTYWRPGYIAPGQTTQQKYNLERRNPWAPAMDEIMFYL